MLTEKVFLTLLSQACEELALELSVDNTQKLYEYFSLFSKWNKSYNLSAIRDDKGILYKHLIDSLALVPYFKARQSGLQPLRRCIDVGTGGGLPGIPLAICFPEVNFTLLDSAGKKIRFLFQVKQALGLDNVELENRRVESLAPEALFDVVTSRAFASMKKFTTLCAHLVGESGEFWAMKGIYPQQELSEMEKHYIVFEHHVLNVPGVEGERCLIKIRRSS